MNKVEFAEIVAKKLGIYKKDSIIYLEAVMDSITEALADGEKVHIVELGTFYPKTRKAHQSIAPFAGGYVNVPEKKVAVFKQGVNLRETLNKNRK